MKRLVCLLLCFFLSPVLFLGCSKNSSQTNTTPIAQKTIHPYITELMTSFPEADWELLPDEILYETDEYIYYREDGICYISFHSGNYKIVCDRKDAPSGSPAFNSMEEKYQWLCAPEISDAHEESIRYWNTLVEEKGFIFQDRDRLYTAELPDEYYLKISGIANSLAFQTHERLESGRCGGCYIAVISKDSFISKLTNYYRFQLGNASYETSYSIDENNATVYEYETDVGTRRYVQYCVQIDSQTIFIEECRGDSHSDRVGSTINELYSVDIFGYENGLYFEIDVFYSDPEPLLELVGKIKIVKYDPKQLYNRYLSIHRPRNRAVAFCVFSNKSVALRLYKPNRKCYHIRDEI